MRKYKIGDVVRIEHKIPRLDENQVFEYRIEYFDAVVDRVYTNGSIDLKVMRSSDQFWYRQSDSDSLGNVTVRKGVARIIGYANTLRELAAIMGEK